jgi:tRNA pseudouridine38-40 synthase
VPFFTSIKMRIALGIEYNGSQFHGWQCQPSLRTVQDVVSKALAKVANETIPKIICAGRTDAGVHALEQVVHFDTNVLRPDDSWVKGTNTYLPNDVAIKWAKQVNDDFHARFSAVRRHYRYTIANQKIRPAIMREQFAWYPRKLDEKKMVEAAKYLLGKHDFSSFRDSNCQAKSPIREIYMLDIVRHEHLITIDIVANAFLHHMVRNITGVLLAIGIGKYSPDWMNKVLQSCDRREGDITAQPQGLCLVKVDYPRSCSWA